MDNAEQRRSGFKDDNLKDTAMGLTPQTLRGTIEEFRDPKRGKNYDLLVEDDGLVFPAFNAAEAGLEGVDTEKTPRKSPTRKHADMLNEEDSEKLAVPASAPGGMGKFSYEAEAPSSPAKTNAPSFEGEEGPTFESKASSSEGEHEDWVTVDAEHFKGAKPHVMLDKHNVVKISDEQDEEANYADDESTTRTNYNVHATIKPIMSIKPTEESEGITSLEEQEEDPEEAFFAPAISKAKSATGKSHHKRDEDVEHTIKEQLHHVVSETSQELQEPEEGGAQEHHAPETFEEVSEFILYEAPTESLGAGRVGCTMHGYACVRTYKYIHKGKVAGTRRENKLGDPPRAWTCTCT
jgi:hypothetical protein